MLYKGEIRSFRLVLGSLFCYMDIGDRLKQVKLGTRFRI